MTKLPEGTGKIFRLYENEIGILTPMIADAVGDAIDTYPLEWIEEAIGAAARRNARNWAYVEAILKRWKAEGKNSHLEQKRKDFRDIPDNSVRARLVRERMRDGD